MRRPPRSKLHLTLLRQRRPAPPEAAQPQVATDQGQPASAEAAPVCSPRRRGSTDRCTGGTCTACSGPGCRTTRRPRRCQPSRPLSPIGCRDCSRGLPTLTAAAQAAAQAQATAQAEGPAPRSRIQAQPIIQTEPPADPTPSPRLPRSRRQRMPSRHCVSAAGPGPTARPAAPPAPAAASGGPFELAASASPANPISEQAQVTVTVKATQGGAPLAGASCMATVYYRTATAKQPNGGFTTNGNGVGSFTLDARGTTYGFYIPIDVTCSGARRLSHHADRVSRPSRDASRPRPHRSIFQARGVQDTECPAHDDGPWPRVSVSTAVRPVAGGCWPTAAPPRSRPRPAGPWSSACQRPTIWSPTGSPSDVKPHGTVAAGWFGQVERVGELAAGRTSSAARLAADRRVGPSFGPGLDATRRRPASAASAAGRSPRTRPGPGCRRRSAA